MTDIHLIIAVVMLVLLGAFFSGTETGIYRLSRFRLRLGLEQRSKTSNNAYRSAVDGK